MPGSLLHARDPLAFARRIVVLRAAFPAVVGAFVIVHRCNHRQACVQCLEIGIDPIAGIAQPVIG